MSVKIIGVKDEKGNNVCLISVSSNKHKPPEDLWDKYEFKEVFWVNGDSMAHMIVKRVEDIDKSS